MNEDFREIEIEEPRKADYCEIKVVSYFKGWYLPECENWTWLMDESVEPISHVESWRPTEYETGGTDASDS